MRKMKKLLSAILALLLVAGLSPVMPAKADSAFGFTLQPADGTADMSESCTFTWALNSAPDSIELESFSPSGTGWGSIKPLPCVAGTTSDSVSYISWYHIPSGSTYRIRATKGSDTIYSNNFEVEWTGNEPSEYSNALDCIEITTAPDTTAYTAGQKFDPAGMVITAKYFNAPEAVVTNYTISPSGGLATTDTSVTISYTEGNITKTATQAITVSAAATKTLSSIAITTEPTTTTYTAGQNFDPAGMVVTATYSDNSTAEVSGYTVSPSGALATTDTYVTISYTEGNITKTALQSITVIANASKTLISIAITTEPTWTTYKAGQNFNPSGMVVTATYSDNSTTEVTDYSISPSGDLTSTDTSVTISYTEDNITKTATQEITVVFLSSISITTEPTTTTYTAGQSFDTTGMVVTATYSDNNTREVAAYTYSPSGALSTADTSVTIGYTEANVTKTATQAITVVPAGTAGFGFTLQPADGTADMSKSYTFTWALNSAPDSIELESFSPSG
ncbi:MAG: bacterial Ig-like domain-containing protein, partial [Lachnospiraceae bacterium]|nr:bacterial Ig-like domain-containing protein [Lachnospiraceae bacterium]